MKMVEWYGAIEKLLERVDFGAIYPGFHRYPFALYTSREICLNGEVRPYEAGFIGNTAIPYQGEYTAIWNVEDDSTEDMEAFAASIVHEMFHCHQFASGEKRFPSDLAMLAHPADAAGMNARYGEARYLVDAFENGDSSALRRFAALRAARRRNDPGLVEQELKTETIEGAAEFAGMKALRHLNEEKFAAETKRYLQILRAGDETLFDTRQFAYYSGTMFFLALEKLRGTAVNEMESDRTAYDQNPIDTDGVEAEARPYECIARQYEARERKKKAGLEAFLSGAQYVPCDAFICGYDPMNMFRVGDVIYCGRFVCLNENGSERSFLSAVALKLAPGAENRVIGYFQ